MNAVKLQVCNVHHITCEKALLLCHKNTYVSFLSNPLSLEISPTVLVEVFVLASITWKQYVIRPDLRQQCNPTERK